MLFVPVARPRMRGVAPDWQRMWSEDVERRGSADHGSEKPPSLAGRALPADDKSEECVDDGHSADEPTNDQLHGPVRMAHSSQGEEPRPWLDERCAVPVAERQ
ncbi:hypothetical protein SAMN04487819_105190 [Actinopolyspora alba]|uniref:Uncharacterized protein n=1 Tax=Actinopolyspora alba TaxID=673379 RepID=A0A1I1WDY1_9ACTN|nr:hypothetical protein SAMN04487819_105190 [Actinopolyspora alba]